MVLKIVGVLCLLPALQGFFQKEKLKSIKNIGDISEIIVIEQIGFFVGIALILAGILSLMGSLVFSLGSILIGIFCFKFIPKIITLFTGTILDTAASGFSPGMQIVLLRILCVIVIIIGAGVGLFHL